MTNQQPLNPGLLARPFSWMALTWISRQKLHLLVLLPRWN